MLVSQDQGKWTYQRLVAELPAESRYEIRDYNLIKIAAPTIDHQDLVYIICNLLKEYCKKNAGYAYLAPVDVILDNSNVVQPDVLFILEKNKDRIHKNGIVGAPDLVVEIVSKGSIPTPTGLGQVSRDYIEKKNDYEKFGVKEYWIIDSMNQSIWVHSLNENGVYELFSHAELEEIAKSKLLDGFELGHLIFNG